MAGVISIIWLAPRNRFLSPARSSNCGGTQVKRLPKFQSLKLKFKTLNLSLLAYTTISHIKFS